MENADESVCVHVCLCMCVSPPLQPCVWMCVHGCWWGIYVSAWKTKCSQCLHLQEGVCAHTYICAAHSWRILFKKLSRLLLCLPCHYNYKGHLTLNPHSLSPPSNIWPVFLLWLNDWMHPHRFLLTSSPIWNLVPVRSAEDAHTCAHVQTQDTHTHTSKAEITKAFVCALRAEERPGND